MSIAVPSPDPASQTPFVSTGHLPADETVRDLISSAEALARSDRSGHVSEVYPALAEVEPDLLGIALVGASGRIWTSGDSDVPFTIMSVSKPFVFAIVCELLGPELLRNRVGVNATGQPFNSLAALESSPDGRTNPMVNSGAILTTNLIPGATPFEREQRILCGLSKFAGRDLSIHEEVLASARATNTHNQSLAAHMHARGVLPENPMEAVDLYTVQCAIKVTARDLAVMGATLANGGLNPLTGTQVVSALTCHYTLAVMATAGLYETSGDWLYEIGLPGKSGIGGGIVTVSPGKCGLGTFAPRLDATGNSVRGILIARYLSQAAGLDLFLA